jgi:predicted nucleotidyltransferase
MSFIVYTKYYISDKFTNDTIIPYRMAVYWFLFSSHHKRSPLPDYSYFSIKVSINNISYISIYQAPSCMIDFPNQELYNEIKLYPRLKGRLKKHWRNYMTDNIENILTRLIQAFSGVAGIDAIVLGGSRATGTANKDSDIDIGIYYDEASFDLSSFRQKAESLDDEHRTNIIADPGEWGPWINGGSCINGIE